MKLFYDFENEEFLTETDVKRFYEMLTDENKKDCNYSFEHYIECCHAKNNGCLITLDEYETFLKSKIAKIKIDEYSIDELVNYTIELQNLYEFKQANNQ